MRAAAALSVALLVQALTALPPRTASAQNAEAAENGPPEAEAESDAVTLEDARAREAQVEAERRERQIAMRAHNSRLGPVGGFHVIDAGSGPAGSLRLSIVGEWMAKDDFLLPDDSNRLGGLAAALSVTPTEWLELSAAMTGRSLDNRGHPDSPGVLQSFGDVMLNLKLFHEVRPGLTLGGDVGVWLLNGQEESGKELRATSATLHYNMSLDLRKLAARSVPMLLRLNLGYRFDNSARTVEGVEEARLDAIEDERGEADLEYAHLITRVERFALNVNRVDRVDIAVGAEWPVETERVVVSPLLEWVWGVPINRQNFTCPYPRDEDGDKLPGVDSCLSDEGLDTWPSTLTAGLVMAPRRHEALRFLAAVDVGLSGTARFVQELAPNAPYTVYAGLSYAVDMKPREKVVTLEVEVEKPVPFTPPTGRVKGRVVNQETGAAIGGARVSFVGRELTDLMTGPAGDFASYPFDPETQVQMEVEAEGYEPARCSATIPEDASDVEVTCELKMLPQEGSAHLRVLDSEGAPVPGTRVMLRGPETQVLTTTSTGEADVSGLAAGEYTARVEVEDHLIRVESLEIEVGETTDLRIQLREQPRRAQVRLRGDSAQLRGSVLFVDNTASLDPRSEPLLEELADFLMRNPELQKLEVQGHTDDVGDADYNQQLSEQRAQTVVDWLVQHGVASQRLIARGYGATEQLVPNITPRNREKNRRIEVEILERSGE